MNADHRLTAKKGLPTGDMVVCQRGLVCLREEKSPKDIPTNVRIPLRAVGISRQYSERMDLNA